jgi:uncharacterized membrane protein
MRAEFWAILTAVCWSVGSYFEKKGVALGEFHPVMGSTIRTVTSVLFLSAMILIMSIPAREQLYHAARNIGWKPILMIMIAGGVFAGGIGIISLYQAIHKGSLSIVLPIAFCLTPVLGVIIGVWFNKEILKPLQMAGVALTIVGAAMTVYFKAPPAPKPDSTKQVENRTTLSNA